jgi:hypothetical protein
MRLMTLWAVSLCLYSCGPVALSADFETAADVETVEADIVTALKEKDLAIAFALDDREAPKASTSVAGAPLLSRAHYAQVSAAFERTSVGSALTEESRYEDLRLVSMRVAPCAPLTNTPQLASQWCWPEVRLVLQPILYKTRIREVIVPAYAEDRAIHLLYDVRRSGTLDEDDLRRIDQWLRTIRTAAASNQSPFAPLTAAETAQFLVARNKVIRGLVSEATLLRSATFPSGAYQAVGVRPESASVSAEARAFATRVSAFLSRHASSLSIRNLTAFSLPEGREPALIDEWVFIAFAGSAGTLTQESISFRSRSTGAVLVDTGTAPRGSQTRDDDTVYEVPAGPAKEAIATQVLLGPRDLPRLKGALSDRQQLQVSNTTCASCHKLNALRFDFHNFGYLEDRPLTVSPRVTKDVALDLDFVNQLGL